MGTWEWTILDFIQQHIKNDVLDAVMPTITFLGDAGIIWILISFALLISRKHRKTGIILIMAMVIDAVLCNGIIKPLIGRMRPFEWNADITLLITPPKDASFPSGHTAISFAVVMVLYLRKERYWYLALILAILIAFSRMYLYVHFPTDILGGCVLGVLCGVIAGGLYRLVAWGYELHRKKE